MDLTPGQKALLPYWGTIQRAVSERASTADLWAAVKAVAQSEGIDLRGASGADMSRMRGIAAGQRNAMESLAASPLNTAITAGMIGTDLSARSLTAQNLTPSWIVRFEHDVTIDGQLTTFWRSSVFDGSLPPTVGQLRAQVEADAGQLADDYGVTHIGVGRIQIAAV